MSEEREGMSEVRWMSTQERYVGFDWLRFIAAIGIVGCHLALPNMTDGAWWIKQFTDLNVGVFAAIAGFFMANSLQQKDVSFESFVGRRVKRLLVPIVSLVSLLHWD